KRHSLRCNNYRSVSPTTLLRRSSHRGFDGCPGTLDKATSFYTFFFDSDFATSRAVSMKALATGLNVRVFRVMIPTCSRASGNSTGKTLNADRPVRNFNAEAGKTEKKRPADSRLSRAS